MPKVNNKDSSKNKSPAVRTEGANHQWRKNPNPSLQMIEPHVSHWFEDSAASYPEMAYTGQGGLWPTSQCAGRPMECWVLAHGRTEPMRRGVRPWGALQCADEGFGF